MEKITVYGDEAKVGTITLSWEHNLRQLEQLRSIQLPSTIEKTIGKEKGEVTVLPENIDTVYFSKNLRVLGDFSFVRCKFTSLVFSKDIALTELAFASIDQNPNLISLDLSGCTHLRTIGSTVLLLHPSLMTLIFPRSLTTIGVGSVRACPRLTTVIWRGEKAPNIAVNCFTDCPLLQDEIILHETA